jgi:hypothetical protein
MNDSAISARLMLSHPLFLLDHLNAEARIHFKQLISRPESHNPTANNSNLQSALLKKNAILAYRGVPKQLDLASKFPYYRSSR